MAERLARQLIAEKAIVHEAPVLRRPHQVDRSFELPTGLYAATVGLFLAYLALMGTGFAHPEMILPMAIFVVFIVAGFGVPALWVTMKPESGQTAMSWSRFRRQGIMTQAGHSTAGAATVQVLILPALIFVWGLAVVTIAALVR